MATFDNRLVGVILEPERVDGQADEYDADVIEATAHHYLARKDGTVSVMHGKKHQDIHLVESSLVPEYECPNCKTKPEGMILGNQFVRKGTWLGTFRVDNDQVWGKYEGGELKGVSPHGKAVVERVGHDPTGEFVQAPLAPPRT